jgi:hypothetical protein
MSFCCPLSLLFRSIVMVLLASAPAFAEDGVSQAHVENSAAPASPLAAEPLDRLSATRERPLFSPTRRPPPPPPVVVHAPEPPPPPPPPPSVMLFGVVTDGDEARAIVRTGPATDVMRVRIGDDIAGWKVSQIDGQRIILMLDDRVATFTMFAGNNVPWGAPKAPPGGPESRSQAPSQNQSPQNEPAQPPRRRRGNLSGQR